MVEAIDQLEQDGKSREAEQLRAKLNTKSVHTAFNTAHEQGYLVSAARQVELIAPDEKIIKLSQWKGMSAEEREACLEQAAAKSKAGFNLQKSDSIEWALWSWNPVTGCEHNCSYCFGRDLAKRFYEQGFVPTLLPDRLHSPHNVKVPKEAAKNIGHKNVFVCSMADLFGRWVPQEWIDAVLDVVWSAPQWNFLFLTKNPKRLTEFEFPSNAWVGTSVDCQARVAGAEAAFREVKAGVKWLSCEPLLEHLQFTDLSIFNWVVLGGASKSSQTPEFHPPRIWVNDIEAKALEAGCRVYEKANLLERRRDYPGNNVQEVTEAPQQLRYPRKEQAA